MLYTLVPKAMLQKQESVGQVKMKYITFRKYWEIQWVQKNAQQSLHVYDKDVGRITHTNEVICY